MKIVYIAYSIIPSRSANSVHVMKMCQAFAENGHEVLLLASDAREEYEKNIDDIYNYYGVKNYFKIKKIFSSKIKVGKLITISQLISVLIKEKPDFVFGRDMIGCFISSLFKYKTAYETHTPYKEIGKKSKLIFNSMIKNKSFQRLIVISAALKQMYKNDNIYDERKIFVVHDGADKVENFESKVQLFGEAQKLKIGYIGHLYQGRGIDLILGIARVLDMHEFHIVGGTEEDIYYWKCELEKSNIKNVFFYGYKTPNETSKYRNSVDILLAPYAKEVKVQGNVGNTSAYMSPLKIFEYMSHKKPIITSDLPVLKEVLNEKNSILAIPEDINSWVNSIIKLEDKEIRKKIATNACNDFLENYTWQIRAKKIIDELNNEK